MHYTQFYMKICCAICLLISLGCSLAYGQEATDRGTILKTILQKVSDAMLSSEEHACRDTLETVTTHIVSEFDTWLACPECYRDTALKECAAFPEGRIYSFAIPALGYANLAIKHPDMTPHALQQMNILIDLMIPVVIEDTDPPEGDLLKLATYQQEATYFGTLNLVLSHYALLGGTNYAELHDHLSEILYQAARESGGESLASYPEYTWHFDTLFVLLSLHLYDRLKGLSRTDELLQQHLAWKQQHAIHAETGLPIAHENSLPRGCDLSMQICLFAQFAPETAQEVYRRYVQAHWIDRGFLAGFSEWPKGTRTSWGDFDSGPVLFDIGLTATGVGLGTAQAMQDQARFERLCRQLTIVSPMIQALAAMDQESDVLWWFKNYAELNPAYFSGFLYGDAILLYALTWTPYPDEWR